MESKLTQSGSSTLFSTDIFENKPVTEATKETAPKEESVAILTSAEQAIFDSLTDQEKAELDQRVREMDFTESEFTLKYGKDVRQGLASINHDALSITRTRDLGKVGESMTHLMLQLKGLDLPSETHGIFKRSQSYVAMLNAKLAPAEKNVAKAVKVMEKYREQLDKDNKDFKALYLKNLAYYRALTLHIIAMKLKLHREKTITLVELHKKAARTGDPADSEVYNSYSSYLNQVDSLLGDFEGSRLLALQSAPAIRMAEENNKIIIQKLDFLLSTAVDAWYTQIHLALNMENSKQAANVANKAIDFTNELIRQNADMLKQGTIEVAKLAEREVFETSTLEYANQRLIETMESIFKIHAEGKAKRDDNHEKQIMLEEDLKNELLQLIRDTTPPSTCTC